jgi:hypothetical protein
VNLGDNLAHFADDDVAGRFYGSLAIAVDPEVAVAFQVAVELGVLADNSLKSIANTNLLSAKQHGNFPPTEISP